ncbi:MAG: polyphenol oxidase family protein [Acidimicrobiaceae bacterium]|nr:polyphenol oxidase family protein [Acidimicrobiia bacterium]MCY4493828.1 polyphenol oxidase family protein [Acidimicrobiaceae bacterium]
MIERTLQAGRDHVVRVVCSERCDGDFAIDADPGELARARARLVSGQWTWLEQVHGSDIVVVHGPGARRGAAADGCVTGCVDARLSVQTADCAPLVLASEGLVGLVHAGWRGIVQRIVPAATDLLGALGGGRTHALLGPCIAASRYGFGAAELDLVASVAGDCVRSTTADGLPALDLAAAVRSQCEQAGVASFSVVGPPHSDVPFDTSEDRWYSHRCRGERQRQATVAWLERR